MSDEQGPQNRGLTSRIGPVSIDWPRTIGYYGGIGLAVAYGVIEPPFGIFIAAIPFFKMLNQPQLVRPVRVISQVLDGAAKPVGGDAESTITLVDMPDMKSVARPTMRAEARRIADRWKPAQQA